MYVKLTLHKIIRKHVLYFKKLIQIVNTSVGMQFIFKISLKNKEMNVTMSCFFYNL